MLRLKRLQIFLLGIIMVLSWVAILKNYYRSQRFIRIQEIVLSPIHEYEVDVGTHDPVNIVLCYDPEEYNAGMKALLHSVMINVKPTQHRLLHFNFIVEPEDEQKANAFLDEFQNAFPAFRGRVHQASWRDWQTVEPLFPEHHFKTSLNLARIYLSSLFPSLEKVISLDTDIIINGNILELWDRADVSELPIAALGSNSTLATYVKPQHPLFSAKSPWKIDLSREVFSGGIFVANLTQWRALDVAGNIHKLLLEHMKKPLLRRALKKTLLNLVLNGRYFRIDSSWEPPENGSCSMELIPARQVKALHFSGFLSKPWDKYSLCKNSIRWLWYHYYAIHLYNS